MPEDTSCILGYTFCSNLKLFDEQSPFKTELIFFMYFAVAHLERVNWRASFLGIEFNVTKRNRNVKNQF